METIVLTHAVIVDGTGAEPIEDGTIVLEGDRIKDVLGGSAGRIPQDAAVIDCAGRTVLPGLIDGHLHISAFEADLIELKRRYHPSYIAARTLQVLKGMLDRGFTTVRDCGGADPGFPMIQAQGLFPSPRLVVCGKGLSQTGGHGDSRLPTERYEPVPSAIGMGGVVVDGVDNCRKAAREQLRSGVDFIKVMAGGGCMSPADEIDTTQYSPEELKAIVFEARAAGTYVAAHCYSDQSIINAVEAGIRTIEHGNLGTDKAARAIKDAGAFLVPTIVTYEAMGEMGKELGIPEVNLKKMIQARDAGMNALAQAHAAGCRIASGSDALGPMQLLMARELEIQARVMGPMGAIVAATKTNAELLRKQDDLGTLEPGKLADLIVVDGDPLKDITLLQDHEQKIALIMQGGGIYKNIF